MLFFHKFHLISPSLFPFSIEISRSADNNQKINKENHFYEKNQILIEIKKLFDELNI